MDRIAFDLYVRTQLVPTLQPGDIVILTIFRSIKVPRPKPPFGPAARACCSSRNTRPTSTWIEMAFAKLKAHLRAAAALQSDALTAALGRVCHLFMLLECQNYFRAVGYASN